MRTHVRRALLAGLVVALVAVLWTGVALLQARADLQQARGLLEQVAEDRDLTDSRELARAQSLLEQASARLRRPGPLLVAAVPFAGRSVVAAREAAGAGAAVVGAGREVLAAVPDRLLTGNRVDLRAAAEVEAALRGAAERTREPVARLEDAELGGTPGALAGPVAEVRANLSDVPARLLRSADGLAALQGVLGAERERRLLIVVQNNAELRATGGLVSVFVQATAVDGRIEFDDFQEVDDVDDPPESAVQVPAPDDFNAVYGAFKPATTLWKNVNMAADVPLVSGVLAEVAAASLPERPDAIIWLDVPAVAAILRATGPVQLPDGSELTADNAVRVLLSEAYARADSAPGEDPQQRRQEELRAAGDAVLRQLLDPQAGTDAVELARRLMSASAARHLAVWSAEPQEQERLASARLTGRVRADGGDLSAFTVHNLGDGRGFGNKLDFYGRRQVTVRVEVARDRAMVEQELAIRNTAPATGLPVYVSGKVDPGTMKQLVTAALPGDAELLEFARQGQALQVSPQPLVDHLVVTDAVSIPPGQTVRWRLRYRLPLEDGRYRTQLVPQPLAVDAGLLLEVLPVEGLELVGDPGTVSGPYDRVVRLDVVAQRPSAWSRSWEAVRRFWNEPVPLP